MKNKRYRAGAKRPRLFRPQALIGWVPRHIRRHPRLYAPAAAPLLFLLVAHLVALPALALARSSAFGATSRTLLTWAVFGFLPFLAMSYLAFLAAARPLADLLQRWQERLPAPVLAGLPAAGYGAAIGAGMFLILRPGNWPGDLALILCCLLAGSLNWFLYRRLAGPGPVSAE